MDNALQYHVVLRAASKSIKENVGVAKTFWKPWKKSQMAKIFPSWSWVQPEMDAFRALQVNKEN